MNEADSSKDDGGTFKTVNCVDVWLDEPGDTTVRPIAPERLAPAKAEWEKIVKYQTMANAATVDGGQPR